MAEQTTRDKIIELLTDHPDGLSRKRLVAETGANQATVREVVNRLQKAGRVTVSKQDTTFGPTNIHRLTA